MCGFAGEFFFGKGAGRADLALMEKLAARLVHRGPDEEGGFLSSDGRCAIGFRRLAIIDPPGSHQPMSSPDGTLTVAFNGEIYNFRQLRQELTAQGCRFRTAGDTEVLLHLYRRDGADMLRHLDGMFAFAIYDAQAGRLMLARDRLGEKPLWYAALAGAIVFASEAKAILGHPAVDASVDFQSITYYLTIGYIPAPASAYRGVRKLPPAHCMIIPASAFGCPAPQRYWQPAAVELPASRAELAELVRRKVLDAVASRMVADVPLGALLSGGVDSSIVVAAMSRAAGRSGGVRTFTAGFTDAQFDERPAAAAVARHCRTEHTELLVQPAPREALNRIVAMYDEPFGDSSALPTWLICQAARQQVKVALVGDGGDETFGGYERYRALNLAATMGPLKFAALRLAAGLARPWAPHNERNRLRRMIRFADAMSYPFAVQYFIYRRLFGPDDLLRLLSDEMLQQTNSDAPAKWFCDLYEDQNENEKAGDEVSAAQRHDLATYLPDDLLVKTDIASMACSLELRAPLLSHQLVELGLSLPLAAKIAGSHGKAILREVFCDLGSGDGLLPAEVFRRPKRGFGVPLGRWLREDLQPLVRELLLTPGRAFGRMFRPEALAGLANDHILGRADHSHRLWALLILARWLDGTT
jgi:asparagine synthase (glutamine-hydrolysing)